VTAAVLISVADDIVCAANELTATSASDADSGCGCGSASTFTSTASILLVGAFVSAASTSS
jgi:hypothetical protein